MDNFDIIAKIYIILKILVIIGAINWGLIALDPKFNLFEILTYIFPENHRELIKKIIYIIISLSAVYVMLQRKTFLPFLDVSIAPVSKFLKESKQKDVELEIVIDAKGGEKVIYWASNKRDPDDKSINDYLKAYGDYDNSGISTVDKDGKAKLYIKCPQEYYVKHNKILPKHLHYRILTKGKLGEVKTVNLSC
jgi:uncharacterized membrane protein YuzA (DUF378 family)